MSIKLRVKYFLVKMLLPYRWAGGDSLTIRRYLAGSGVKKLHVGSGSNFLPGWINADYQPLSLKVVHFDATKVFPFPSNSFDYAFNEHMIEHISHAGAVNMLKEIHRVLKPGGVLRVVTPDMFFLFGLLKQDKSDIESRYIEYVSEKRFPHADRTHRDNFVVNNFFYNYGHRFIYTKGLMSSMLQSAGFSSVAEREILKSPIAELVGLEHVKKAPDGFLELESMIFEATK